MIVNALAGKALPVYGDGATCATGCTSAIIARRSALSSTVGRPGETYNIGGNAEMQNLDVVRTLCELLAEAKPGRDYAAQVTYVKDRPGHDRRYAIDAAKVTRETGWTPVETFATGMRRTVRWYLDNAAWLDSVTSKDYQKWINLNYAAA